MSPEEKREVLIEMAMAMVGSLLSLRRVIEDSPEHLQQWKSDPVRCLTVVIETLEARHVLGLDPQQLKRRVDERMRKYDSLG
jgi:hypothetical protein